MSKRPTPIIPFTLLGILIAVIISGCLATSNTYTLYDGEQQIQQTGHFTTVADVIEASGLELRPQDIVSPTLNSPIDKNVAIQIQRARAVTLRTETETRTLWTHQTNLAGFLHKTGITINRTDQLSADGQRVGFNQLDQVTLPSTIEIGRFTTVTIQDGETQQLIRTAAQTVGDALAEANITLYATDGVEPPIGSWLTPNLLIQIQRSMPLTIHVDGRILHTRSRHTSSTAVLAENGIGLVGFDYVQPSPEKTLAPNDTIQIIRVTEDFRLEDEPIPFQTIWQASDQLDLDTTGLVSAGVVGITRRRIRVRYENGVEVSQQVDGEWVARKPVNEVIGYGTHITIRTLNTPNGPVEYWRKVRMRVTSYTAASSGKAPTHPSYGITASGVQAGKGVVAIDRNVVPFRSYVYIPGYGTAFAGDTGGGIRGRWIDLGFDDHNYETWAGYTDVYYLTPVPAPEDINYLLPATLP